jgi:hypothetical protein
VAKGEKQVSKRTTKDDLKKARERFEFDVAVYVAGHPEVGLDVIAEAFGIDRRELYAIRKRRGLAARTVRKAVAAEKETINS